MLALTVGNDDKVVTNPSRPSADGAPSQSGPTTKSVPPPVNRAEKPKVPTKLTSVASKFNLGPILPAADDRVSPFSTPPSSDGSIVPESAEREGLSRHNPLRLASTSTQGSYFSPLPSVPTSQEVHGKLDGVILQGPKTPNARKRGATQEIVLRYTGSEHPPGLPPRKGQDLSNMGNSASPSVNQANVRNKEGAKARSRHNVMQVQGSSSTVAEFLPPPKRIPVPKASSSAQTKITDPLSLAGRGSGSSSQFEARTVDPTEMVSAGYVSAISDYPEASHINRRHPYLSKGVNEIETKYDTKLFDMCGQYICTTGHITRVWDTNTGEAVLSLNHGEKETRVTSLAFKPGASTSDEGSRLWLGTNYGDIQEVDIASHSIVCVTSGAHERREIMKIYRHQSSMWTLDDGGRLCIWSSDDTSGPDLQSSPTSQKIIKGHTFSIILQDMLWLATGKDIRVYRPSARDSANFSATPEPLNQSGVGAVTSGAVIGGQLDRVFFGHADGKVTIYSIVDFTCLGVINVSTYKINSLAGVGFHLWTGYNTGKLCVYDTRSQPWNTKKEWLAHDGPVSSIVADRSSLWKQGFLRVVSLGADNALRQWDGTLEDDWLGKASAIAYRLAQYAEKIADNDMHDRDVEYCSFREITALVVTWNAGAATPTHLRYEESQPLFFQDILQVGTPPDLLVFGFQELVDLEDKTLTASMYDQNSTDANFNCFQRLCSRVIRRRTLQSKNT